MSRTSPSPILGPSVSVPPYTQVKPLPNVSPWTGPDSAFKTDDPTTQQPVDTSQGFLSWRGLSLLHGTSPGSWLLLSVGFSFFSL